MRTLILEALVRNKTAISHNGGEKNGNMGLFRTEQKWYIKDNEHKSFHCPVISANSLRSNLRKISSQIFLDSLGENDEPLKVKIEQFNMLFSGGGQVKKGDKTAGDVAYFENIRDNVAPISLFGASKGNAMIPSKLDVYDMIPVGKETAWLLPQELLKESKSTANSVHEYLKLRFNTTKDLKKRKGF